ERDLHASSACPRGGHSIGSRRGIGVAVIRGVRGVWLVLLPAVWGGISITGVPSAQAARDFDAYVAFGKFGHTARGVRWRHSGEISPIAHHSRTSFSMWVPPEERLRGAAIPMVDSASDAIELNRPTRHVSPQIRAIASPLDSTGRH